MISKTLLFTIFFASVYNMLLPEYKLVLLHTKATSPKATDRTGH